MINLIGSLNGVHSEGPDMELNLSAKESTTRRKIVTKKGGTEKNIEPKQNDMTMFTNELEGYLAAYDSCGTVIDDEKVPMKKRKHEVVETSAEAQRLNFHYSSVVPLTALHSFLAHLDTMYTTSNKNKNSSDGTLSPWSEKEWTLVHRLVEQGLVSLNLCRSLLPAAVANKRLALVIDIARSVSDLDERDSLLLLRMMLSLDDDAFMSLPSDVAPISAPTDTKPVSKKGKKKTADASITSTSNHNNSPATTRLLTIQSLLRALLERPIAFSSVILTAAAKTHLSPTVAVFLLRQLSLLLREYCTGTSSMSQVISDSLTEEQIRRAVVWAESLLDSHFSAIAIHASTDTATRLTLRGLLEVLAAAGESVGPLENALSVCSHAHRMCQFTQPLHKQLQSLDKVSIEKGSLEDRSASKSAHHNGNNTVKTINKMYSIEKLVL